MLKGSADPTRKGMHDACAITGRYIRKITGSTLLQQKTQTVALDFKNCPEGLVITVQVHWTRHTFCDCAYVTGQRVSVRKILESELWNPKPGNLSISKHYKNLRNVHNVTEMQENMGGIVHLVRP